MKIILLKDIQNLGKFGNIITVKSGYARNYLIPYGMALFANKENIQNLQNKKQDVQIKEIIKIKNSYLRIRKIKEKTPIVIFSKASKKGKLFGSIGLKEILNAITGLGIKIKKNELIIRDGLIRNLGNYNIIFQPHKEVSCYIAIKILSR
ncbi:50S ribosomal protein L9 [Buchnera aphidicola]|uniref:Large ribosomal subunit protein bL9 n=1 Tax=Buchnera aphidicola (Therioaphis trifolii) TaxID=1241884 RepID=A0A4D6YE10_9GAMM|nr:50S ribosomal protein L9 [Buchnera aphidicola]QCI27362.1 50S ribosomal protein L9 [Buchnera aphidicola (Therioaphis trifolii)]